MFQKFCIHSFLLFMWGNQAPASRAPALMVFLPGSQPCPVGNESPCRLVSQAAAGMAGGMTRMGVPGPKRQKILRGGSKVSGTEEVKKGPEFGDGSEQLSVK